LLYGTIEFQNIRILTLVNNIEGPHTYYIFGKVPNNHTFLEIAVSGTIPLKK